MQHLTPRSPVVRRNSALEFNRSIKVIDIISDNDEEAEALACNPIEN